ncbi:lipid II:glycine glycyltransferase FemX, partial [Streptomyces sp. NPDC059651]|uniref:lipid II:glycine glycyltransferase FemX n=1 Tax=Streptomyces sp. NPDC059651 TaxID=3346897 RepID=UPI0036A54F55
MTLRVEEITREQHLAFVAGRDAASHMQVPSWGEVKPDWRAESIGWFGGDGLIVGAALVLYRPVPRLKRYLAYLPEGPLIPWHEGELRPWLDPLVAHAKARGAFTVRMGPPVVARRWEASRVKDAIADPAAGRLRDVEADVIEARAAEIVEQLRRLGWQQGPDGDTDGFSAGQPRYVFQVPFAGRSLEEIRGGLNQQWRRNIKKAEKAGVKVVEGGRLVLAGVFVVFAPTGRRGAVFPPPGRVLV